ncbi:MAG TPA: 2-amino-4-hydroxy-6-hydroxymethyldihydropteridine diphosphokinase [Mycobacterium sp.]|nr:MAG: 2-amino-4-hydroxy-6-hydroxymethyldihydropteridine diphosphokinase [Mycobacterium sp.]HOB48732.1 2-amino-4-hydroxy-6-hydroxymethyldihydropteridine diphosphokinase [Mycobacterium sp.]HPZ93469.1 2-amino-4-hydroxy-6-hydroxymethyldihydropteridine diphosphokinase [Mycobacterium sp.]HQE15058.1 2-amino-4-hydroxy-6-hydroxymethyldihydropteridine diphosphokinase [Mycobacterium sp.]
MTRVVLSIGSNLGDRMARLQSVVDGLGGSVQAVSPVFESDPWGGVDQDAFLNAILVAEDEGKDAYDWLARAQELERENDRVREVRWGPRTLDVDLIVCGVAGRDIRIDDPTLTLPHPQAHRRAFVLIPWLAVDPAAELTVHGRRRPVAELLEELDPAERSSVRPTNRVLRTSTGDGGRR